MTSSSTALATSAVILDSAAASSAVGGGSLAYAATLYRAPSAYFQHPQWRDLADWESRLAPHYDTAERMLGVNIVPFDSEGDRIALS